LAREDEFGGDTQSHFADMNTRTNIPYVQVQISEYQERIQNAVHLAPIVAGALLARHVSAGISGAGVRELRIQTWEHQRSLQLSVLNRGSLKCPDAWL